MTNKRVELGERKADGWGGWSRAATVDGVRYRVSVTRGRAVRIPYKRRGENRGYKWNGSVYGPDARCVWSGDVGGSIGARGLLLAAGIITANGDGASS